MRNISITTIDGVLFVKKFKYNLLNISQLYHKGYIITFDSLGHVIKHKADNERVFKDYRVENVYMLNLDDTSNNGRKCLVTRVKIFLLWHTFCPFSF